MIYLADSRVTPAARPIAERMRGWRRAWEWRDFEPGPPPTGDVPTQARQLLDHIRHMSAEAMRAGCFSVDLAVRFPQGYGWLCRRGYLPPVFADFLDLRGRNLRGGYFADAVFRYCTMDDADFSQATMRSAVVGGCSARRASFFRINLRGATLVELCATHADFEGADMQRAMIRDCWFFGCAMRAANLEQAQLTCSDFRKTRLDRALTCHCEHCLKKRAK